MTAGAYSIFVRESVRRSIRRFPRLVLERIRNHIAALAQEPFPPGVEKMQGYDHYYRIRVGDYRIVYEVSTQIRIISIVAIGHRKDIYKKL